jgi:hypothetical protein
MCVVAVWLTLMGDEVPRWAMWSALVFDVILATLNMINMWL